VSLIGQERATDALLAALAGGTLHHAWLLAGPAGVGKGTFARAAALYLLAAGAGEAVGPGLDVPAGRTRALVAAGSHPDWKLLERLPRDEKKPEAGLARTITVDQVRALIPLFATRPALSSRRVVIVDAADDLAREGANALLKNLEEPPAGTVFLLVSHAPGRLLPTIRSRCRLLRFDPLPDAAVAQALREQLPDADAGEIAALVAVGAGSPGRALGYAGLDVAGLDTALAGIARDGDPDSGRRIRLARELAGKGAQGRFDVFLDRAPALIANAAATRHGSALRTALDAYEEAQMVAAAARAPSVDAAAIVWEMAGLVARLAAG
jgi:DNA polymerase III subunit delta'